MRVVTYNTHKCRGLDGRTSATRIAEVLLEIEADVIALQEVLEHQAETIARELRMNYVLGETRKRRGYAYGNVVLSRFPIRDARNYDLSVRGREERGCLRADLQVNGSVLHVFNVHLGTALLERRVQGRRLVAPELLNAAEIESPRIVLGDFNEWTQGLATRLLRQHLESADLRVHLQRRKTYPGVLPILHLDHIYYDPVLRLERLMLWRTKKALVASDHLPLVGEFRW
ncbi:MAG TPA: endonuclease/exonuclease/phosphatase family protein [Bryobacteraceae bacterium]|jgi:endonuclease/exonuclease/phosphatase family metal-dependent hydrolase|nr:endonuclease/exonuclease/phosphatase family protein [Bryobacteraceae bacterium]